MTDPFASLRAEQERKFIESVEQDWVKQDRCPKCQGELDTGWECNSCGFDAKPIADRMVL